MPVEVCEAVESVVSDAKLQ